MILMCAEGGWPQMVGKKKEDCVITITTDSWWSFYNTILCIDETIYSYFFYSQLYLWYYVYFIIIVITVSSDICFRASKTNPRPRLFYSLIIFLYSAFMICFALITKKKKKIIPIAQSMLAKKIVYLL